MLGGGFRRPTWAGGSPVALHLPIGGHSAYLITLRESGVPPGPTQAGARTKERTRRLAPGANSKPTE